MSIRDAEGLEQLRQQKAMADPITAEELRDHIAALTGQNQVTVRRCCWGCESYQEDIPIDHGGMLESRCWLRWNADEKNYRVERTNNCPSFQLKKELT